MALIETTSTCCCPGRQNPVDMETTKEWVLRRLRLLRKHHWWLDEQLVDNLPAPIKKGGENRFETSWQVLEINRWKRTNKIILVMSSSLVTCFHSVLRGLQGKKRPVGASHRLSTAACGFIHVNAIHASGAVSLLCSPEVSVYAYIIFSLNSVSYRSVLKTCGLVPLVNGNNH